MKPKLFEFNIDNENSSIHIKREFDAKLKTVWEAWTSAELLDKWWAPKPFKNQTKSMDFRKGGFWIYSMIGTEDERYWSRVDFQDVEEKKRFTAYDAFCDENGNINPDVPSGFWNIQFIENENSTIVDILLVFESNEDMDIILDMGFEEGLSMGFENLDELLLSLKKELNE